MRRFVFFTRCLLSAIIFLAALAVSNAQETSIIPQPSEVAMGDGFFALTPKTKIYYNGSLKNEADYLQRLILDEQKLKLTASKGKQNMPDGGNIYLSLEGSPEGHEKDEGYTLTVDSKTIQVRSKSAAGVFYGIQSLRQIIKDKNVQSVVIKDAPRFGWRAFMLDEGRYFKGAKVVKDILDEMALLKMNIFHWHLTDDGGWRIEIKKYPKLTEIGSKRRMSETGTWLSNVFDSVPHSGFYTQVEIKDIIKYAEDRHIMIIPEIEMPGHASAAIASYPWLGAENKQIEVPITFGIKLDIFNVANPKVKQFLQDVLDEVMALFPSKVVHIGGDEVKYDQWKASAEVNEYMKANNIKSPADLQIAFTNGISRYVEQHGHRMIGWNDILGGLHGNNDSTDAAAKEKLSESTIIQFWTGDSAIVTQAVLKGHDVVNSYWFPTYLDYDYNTTPLPAVYNFIPVPASLPQNLRHKILGIGTQMWGEWIPTVERMNYLIYPRIAAMAEVAWTNQDKKNLQRFSKSLHSYLIGYWKSKGISLLPEQLNIASK